MQASARLLEYELAESAHIQTLYKSIRADLRYVHVRVDATFAAELNTVSVGAFRADVRSLLKRQAKTRRATTSWGPLETETLPFTMTLSRTRLYSPDYMERVFRWKPNEEWDGIACEIDDADLHLVHRVKNPRGLRSVSRNDDASLKKSRGITTLRWKAIKQIPRLTWRSSISRIPRSIVARLGTTEPAKSWTPAPDGIIPGPFRSDLQSSTASTPAV